MDSKLRKITRFPLEKLWRPDDMEIGPRIRMLNRSEISNLLRRGQIEFVVADVGHPLRRITPQDCFEFWKTEVKPHLAEPDSRINLDLFSDEYCYTASEWESKSDTIPIILLERHH